ncbi:hypothetical protein Catovirus_1_330 [Catovirus CTV1]|uniref:Uncharacterized protein n=1 Tax=Catovirus CTV1 TaxID=1977631 RepID=A0A1V0S989_9VIRU|nr:hypothetical protein Catovirus_1_330 [Catovirus CTV1]
MGKYYSDFNSDSHSDFSDSDCELKKHKKHDDKKKKHCDKKKKHSDKKHKKDCDTKSTCSTKSWESCNDACRLNCDTKVDVDVLACPSVKCTKVCQKNACFDVALDIQTKPRCHITHKKSKKISDCKERCIFTVNIDCDYKCKPKILNDCHFPQATFDLEVDTKTKQICKARKC